VSGRVAWLPLIDDVHAGWGLDARYFVRFHVPLVTVVAMIGFLPVVQRASGIEPRAMAVLLGVHLLGYALCFLTPGRGPAVRAIASTGITTINVFATAAPAIVCGHAASPLWATYFVYPYTAARAVGRRST
jgi:hypothetical protein